MKSINHSLQMTGRSLTWAVLSLSMTLNACGDEQDDLTTNEAFLESATLSIEEMDLEILDVEQLDENSAVCSLDRIENRGRTHHARRRADRRSESEERPARVGRLEGEAGNEDQDRARRDRRRSRRRVMRRPTALLVLTAYDSDQSGDLNDSEREYLQDDLMTGCEARHSRLIEEFDADGDGQLNEDEVSAARAERAERKEERRAEMENRRETQRTETLELYDADGDGELSREERREAHEARRNNRQAAIYAEFDEDEDGTLSSDERANLASEVQSRVQEGKRPCASQDEESID